MSKPVLSILIPITPDRVDGLQPLLNVINFGNSFKSIKEKNKDGGEGVAHYSELLPVNEKELIIYCDEKKITIGGKREDIRHARKSYHQHNHDTQGFFLIFQSQLYTNHRSRN